MASVNKTEYHFLCTPFTLRHSIQHLFFIIFGIGTDLEENTKKAVSWCEKGILLKKVFFKISQSLGQSTCAGVFVSRVVGLFQPASLSKKWLHIILQNFYKHDFSENLPGTASKSISYFVFKHQVDLRHCNEIKHFHNTHKNVPLKTNYSFKIWKI